MSKPAAETTPSKREPRQLDERGSFTQVIRTRHPGLVHRPRWKHLYLNSRSDAPAPAPAGQPGADREKPVGVTLSAAANACQSRATYRGPSFPPRFRQPCGRYWVPIYQYAYALCLWLNCRGVPMRSDSFRNRGLRAPEKVREIVGHRLQRQTGDSGQVPATRLGHVEAAMDVSLIYCLCLRGGPEGEA